MKSDFVKTYVLGNTRFGMQSAVPAESCPLRAIFGRIRATFAESSPNVAVFRVRLAEFAGIWPDMGQLLPDSGQLFRPNLSKLVRIRAEFGQRRRTILVFAYFVELARTLADSGPNSVEPELTSPNSGGQFRELADVVPHSGQIGSELGHSWPEDRQVLWEAGKLGRARPTSTGAISPHLVRQFETTRAGER